MRPLIPMGLTSLILLGACSEHPTTPVSRSTPTIDISSVAAAGGTGVTGRQIVSFSNAVPSDFAAQVAALGGKVDWSSQDAGLASVSGISASDAPKLGSIKGVNDVVADEALAIDLPATLTPEGGSAAPANTANPAAAFFFPRQWNMRAVSADVAWAGGHLGDSHTTVYMLDSGIDYLHLDLIGLVDLAHSIDLTGTFDVGGVPFTEADTVAKYFPARLPITDLFFHGTHTAATVSSNALVAAGVNSKTTLVAVKVCTYIDACPFSSILSGVIYAAQNNADVINMSLGGAFTKAGNGKFAGLLNKTFNFARSRGVTIVVAAGNAATDMDHDGNTYETFCGTPSTICVAATGPTAQASVNGPWTNIDAPAFYTNFGRSAIDLAAPGGNNSTFVWAACSETSLLVPVCGLSPTFVIGAEGTSMAAPHVAGAAALLIQTLGRNPSQIKAQLQQTADDLGQPGTDPFYGKGFLNIGRAVGTH